MALGVAVLAEHLVAERAGVVLPLVVHQLDVALLGVAAVGQVAAQVARQLRLGGLVPDKGARPLTEPSTLSKKDMM